MNTSFTYPQGLEMPPSVTDRLSLGVPLIVALLTAYYLPGLFKKDALASIPMVGEGSIGSRKKKFASGGAEGLYAEGYRRFKDGIFRIATTRKSETLVVSPRFLPELKRLPDDVLSFGEANLEFLQAAHTKIQTESASIPPTIKKSLTPALARLNPVIADEVASAMRDELPQSDVWTPCTINEKLLRVVAVASGRVFVGPELCRHPKYLDAAINYTIDLMTAVHVVDFMPLWLRPIIGPWIPPVTRVQRRTREANEFLGPVVKARRAAAERNESNYDRPEDMLQWLMDTQMAMGEVDELGLAKDQLSLCFAAIHTTTATATNAMYVLAANPDLIPMLRDDVREGLAKTGGEFTSSALQSMKRLDSFLKEIFRLYPLISTSFQRKVLKPITLSNGQPVPAGIIIEAPATSISADPDVFPSPETFDALRSYRLREASSAADSSPPPAISNSSNSSNNSITAAKSQCVSIDPYNLTFGYGRHACPGRFFAVNEIKMILANLLLGYDVKMPEGVDGVYPTAHYGLHCVPDQKGVVMLRKL